MAVPGYLGKPVTAVSALGCIGPVFLTLKTEPIGLSEYAVDEHCSVSLLHSVK